MDSQHQTSTVRTPCIGICSTVFGDKVCRGCKRYSHEIIAWNSYSDAEKSAVERRLDDLLAQIVGHKLRILDAELLQHKLRQYSIRSRSDSNSAVWIFDLLRAGASQIRQPIDFGFEVHEAYRETSLVELRDSIERDFFLLSEAHYERYFRV